MRLLELFSGTGSVGKVARKLNYEVISVDIDEKFKPVILGDILELDIEKMPTPDFIWASPPCNTYSWLICSGKTPSRNCKPPYQALTDVGKLGDRILNRTLEIIKFFHNKNKNLKWVIENPRGMMRLQPQMKNIPIALTSYCRYGDNRNKPTDFFNNFELKLKPLCIKSNPCKGCHVGVVDICLTDRIKIPPALIRSIFNQVANPNMIVKIMGGGITKNEMAVLMIIKDRVLRRLEQ